MSLSVLFFFFQAEDGIRDHCVTGVQTCALPISASIEFEQPAAAAAGMEDRFPEGLQPQGPAFPIHTIRQDGMALLPEAVFARVTAPFVGRSIGVEHINVLLERVNRALIAAGYTTSRAYVGNQS